MSKVVKECPILLKYEDAWPVKVINRRQKHSSPSSLTNWTGKYIVSSIIACRACIGSFINSQTILQKTNHVLGAVTSTSKSHAAQAVEQPRVHSVPSRAYTLSDGDSEPGPSATGQLSGLARWVGVDTYSMLSLDLTRSLLQPQQIMQDLSAKASTSVQLETTPNINASNHFAQLASRLTVTPHNAPIQAFLQTLVPEQTALLPVFIAMGVSDNAALQGLARMNMRDEFLYSWVKQNLITELQFAVIIEALRTMHNIPPMSIQVTI